MGDEILEMEQTRFLLRRFFPEFEGIPISNVPNIYQIEGRVASSSEDADEIEELRKQSEIELKRCLSWWDLTWLALAPLLEPASLYSLAKKLMNMPDQLQFYPMWFLAFKQYSLFSATQHLQ